MKYLLLALLFPLVLIVLSINVLHALMNDEDDKTYLSDM